MRWLITAAIVGGAVSGLIWPATGHAVIRYSAYIAPPSRLDGNLALLTCGWHQTCGSGQDGPALDWAPDTVEFGAHFRGWFVRSSAPLETNRLLGKAFAGTKSPFADDMATDAIEQSNGTPRFRMHYIHAYRDDTSWFNIPTSAAGAWSSRRVAWMADDSVGCPWTGYHVHEYGIYFVAVWGNRTLIPYVDDYCPNHPNPPCQSYLNNGSGSFSQWASWDEGG